MEEVEDEEERGLSLEGRTTEVEMELRRRRWSGPRRRGGAVVSSSIVRAAENAWERKNRGVGFGGLRSLCYDSLGELLNK